MTSDGRHSPEYISFLLVRLCHTYDQTMHILQEFVPLKPVGRRARRRERERIKTKSQKSHFMAFKEEVQPSTTQNINCDKARQTSSHGGMVAYQQKTHQALAGSSVKGPAWEERSLCSQCSLELLRSRPLPPPSSGSLARHSRCAYNCSCATFSLQPWKDDGSGGGTHSLTHSVPLQETTQQRAWAAQPRCRKCARRQRRSMGNLPVADVAEFSYAPHPHHHP